MIKILKEFRILKFEFKNKFKQILFRKYFVSILNLFYFKFICNLFVIYFKQKRAQYLKCIARQWRDLVLYV